MFISQPAGNLSMSNERERLHNLFPDLDFDPAELRAKYRAERDKRLREDGEAQYLEAADTFAHYADDDPYADPGFDREPVQLELDVVVIGAGFSGLMTAARLKERGITNFRIIESGGDFGGTWYWNRYPGAQCDIESYCYLPLLEETGIMPKEKYSYAPEIFEHTQRIGEYFGLYDNTIFHRVMPGFVVQGGGYTEAIEERELHAPIINESGNGLKNLAMTVAMARCARV